MTDRDFVYWLRGFFELADPNTVTPSQVATIKEHLALVFEQKTGKPALDKAITPPSERRYC